MGGPHSIEGFAKDLTERLMTLASVPNIQEAKNKAIRDFILMTLAYVYNIENPNEIAKNSGSQNKYRDPRAIMFYLVTINTGISYESVATLLKTGNAPNITANNKRIKAWLGDSNPNSIAINVRVIQERVDKFIEELNRWSNQSTINQ